MLRTISVKKVRVPRQKDSLSILSLHSRTKFCQPKCFIIEFIVHYLSGYVPTSYLEIVPTPVESPPSQPGLSVAGQTVTAASAPMQQASNAGSAFSSHVAMNNSSNSGAAAAAATGVSLHDVSLTLGSSLSHAQSSAAVSSSSSVAAFATVHKPSPIVVPAISGERMSGEQILQNVSAIARALQNGQVVPDLSVVQQTAANLNALPGDQQVRSFVFLAP